MSIISGIFGADAASKAADAGVSASRDNIALARDIFNTARADNALFRDVGNRSALALGQLMGLVPKGPGPSPVDLFRKSPGYQFRLGEGVKALDRSAAARGLLRSGGTMKAVQRYGEGLASDEFNNYVNRLGTLAGFGTNANASNQAAGANLQSGVTAANNAAAQARISGYGSQAGALGGAAGGAANAALLAKLAGWI